MNKKIFIAIGVLILITASAGAVVTNISTKPSVRSGSLYEHFDSLGNMFSAGAHGDVVVVETFFANGNHSLNKVALRCYKGIVNGEPIGNAKVSIRYASDLNGSDLTSWTGNADTTLPEWQNTSFVNFTMNNPIYLINGVEYAIVASAPQAVHSVFAWDGNGSSSYDGTFWIYNTFYNEFISDPVTDLYFRVYGNIFAVSIE